MNTETRVKNIATEIIDYKFDSHYAPADYEWLAQRCKALAVSLQEDKAQKELVSTLIDITHELEEQNISLTHALVRERTLVFHKETILYNLMREGYLKMALFSSKSVT